MSAAPATRDLVLAISPCGQPSAWLVATVCRAAGLGILDLGSGDRWSRQALDMAAEWCSDGFGVRVSEGCSLTPGDLPGQVDTVVVGGNAPWPVADLVDRYRVLVEVTSVDEATAAAASGAHGLIARGNESGGRVGELSSFVLLQRLMAQDNLALPVWLAGGIGLRTAAAAVVGGAAGVVLDTQLALLAEADLPEDVAGRIRSMDGSETVIVDGHRLLRGRAGADGDGPPVGQDGFLAARFAERFGDTTTAVRAVRSAILDALDDAEAARILLPGAALATDLGVAVPVVQGPMTRVSDEPGFAAAVADAGGLPFIALALSTAEQTRSVLERTCAELGDRPWGVGVLGFAPEELRAAQLAAVREIQPSCAIIAGGRPSQASALEAVGIKTFLHVPAPGLLRQFLDAGARKFVFEGAECGGHVGPRSSFPLWEAQIAVIEDFLDAHGDASPDVQILLAGGIHDARSAAMAAVLAAPLAGRGVRVGVLMGTAYLFTAEAVDSGAIRPAFQRQVLAADRTDLLETAPGHATRCVASPFSADFRARSAEMESAGVPSRERWEALEGLNIGRLRVASKGLRRDGASLVGVDEPGQVADGLFMAGQVAVLRSAVTTVADLHQTVTTGATQFHSDRTAALRQELRPDATAAQEAPAPLGIAIVGMACVFAGSPDLASFWQTIVSGADRVTEVSPDRWDPDVYYSPDGGEGKVRSKWGGFIDPVPFDPLRYGIPPAALGSIDPGQLIALEVARRALDDSGHTGDHSRTSVVFGAEAATDLSNAQAMRGLLPSYLDSVPEELAGQLPALTEDSFPGVLSNVIAGRIANRLDLGGANYTVDAACASALAAVNVACRELISGTSDLVLCGAVDLHNSINDYMLFASVGALSPTGRSKTFDASADGIALGEGVACVVLKRLADAQRDGDRIYAVIDGVGSASDGRALGLTAPRPEGQRRALERAYANARISPADVGLIEAHGTGTVVGDRTELGSLTRLFEEAGARPGSCAIGSVKSQIGHTKCAAGLAGLIKATMSLYTGVVPPTVHLERPNAGWDADRSPFVFHKAARPWAAPPAERAAGVSAFGFGGANFHVVLRAAEPQTAAGPEEWPVELFAFRGRDRAAAHRIVTDLLEEVATNDRAGRPWRLRDLAAANSRRFDSRDEPVQAALVARGLDHLSVLLGRLLAGEHAPTDGLFQPADATTGPGKVAFLFPGQGSQRPGMVGELFVTFPELRRYLRMGRAWVDTMYPPAAFDPDRAATQDSAVRDTRVAQPALGIAGLAVEHLLARLGVRPDMLGGHSYGELVALSAAGAFDADTLLELSAARAGAILTAAGGADDAGAMAAVGASRQQIETLLIASDLADRVVLANVNGPRQIVVSGPTADVDAAVDVFRVAGIGAKRIPVACAFHSPVVSGAVALFDTVLADKPLRAPELPVWSNRTAAPYPCSASEVRAELAAHVGSPVRFAEQIEAMYAAGARVFVEVGPGQTLSRLVADIIGDRPHTTVACEDRPGAGLRGFLEAVARLAVAGVPLRTGWLFAHRGAADVAPGRPPAMPGWTVNGHLVRGRDGAVVPGGLTPAKRIAEGAMTTSDQPRGQRDPDALISEFLRTSRDMVAAQRDVLLAYFGGVPAAGPLPAPVAPTAVLPTAVLPTAVLPTAVLPTAVLPTPMVSLPVPAVVVEPVAAVPAVAAPAAADPATFDVLGTVLAIISERTGYPPDMVELDLDLEADLSIDSIKRTEIAGELASRLGVGAAGRLADAEIEELVKARTARAIADWLTAKLDESAGPAVAPVAVEPVAAVAVEPVAVVPAAVAPRRLVARVTPSPLPSHEVEAVLTGATIAVTGMWEPVSEALTLLLTERGAMVVQDADGPVDGLIHLTPPGTADDPVLPGVFADFQRALRRSPRWLLAAHAGAEGMPGLFRTIRREYPQMTARAVEFDPAASPGQVAHTLIDEMLSADAEPVVVHHGGARHRIELLDTPLGALGTNGAGPAGDGASEAEALGIGHDSVVVLIGGARGITARFALALAAASRCRIELVGRTLVPTGPEAPDVAAATDPAALRAALLARGGLTPAEIERQIAGILAYREVAETQRALSRLGSRVRYHSTDVRDGQAVHRLVKEILAEHGHIDGVVYAAGIIEDRMLADKDPESFHRVYGTKVDGARALLSTLDKLDVQPRFVVMYGSIAGVLGNRGQADYAAANDALETIGQRWSAATGTRCLTVHWGPWAPTGQHDGMVSETLQREYARRGVTLIDPEEGALGLMRELAWGDPALPAVVYTASGW